MIRRSYCVDNPDKLDYRDKQPRTVGSYQEGDYVHMYFHGSPDHTPLGVNITKQQAEFLMRSLECSIARCTEQAAS